MRTVRINRNPGGNPICLLRFVKRHFGIFWQIFVALGLFQFELLAQSEKHLKNIQQLTFGGDNAEAYFNFKGDKLTFQSNNKNWGLQCDQIFVMDISKAVSDSFYKPAMISNGKGRTTCSYFLPGDNEVLFASTHLKDAECPPVPERKEGKYLWAIYNSYDIFIAGLNGNIVKQLTNRKGYDAEATVSPKGDKIVFTSDLSGDLELWTMNIDGTNLKQITNDLGYDGGAFFSSDGKKIVFRASRPKTEQEIKEYKELFSQGQVSPTQMEIFICNADGLDLKQITSLGKANWAPFYHPSNKKIIFSSNHHSQKGYDFQLFMINEDGSGLEQITFESHFNAFPIFSPNGKNLVFSSNRNNGGTRDTNVFIADWED